MHTLKAKVLKKTEKKAISLLEGIVKDYEFLPINSQNIRKIEVKSRTMLCKLYTEDQKLNKETSEWLTKVFVQKRLSPRKLKETLKLCIRATTANDAEAMMALANLAKSLRDSKGAFEWYLKAAEQGNAKAMLEVAFRLDRGNGVNKDIQKAFTYYEKAAQNEHPMARRIVADCYKLGRGVEPDAKKRMKWLKIAAKKGDANDKYNYAELYRNGTKTKNNPRMYHWYQLAAQEGHVDAMFQYGIYLAYNKGDTTNAIVWLAKASEAKHPSAPIALDNLCKREAE